MKKTVPFTLRTVRGKIIMVSKLAGMVLIISYVISTRLPVSPDDAFLLWFGFVILLVLILNRLMGRFISDPVSRLNQAASRMARLDFSMPCQIHTTDEFGELSENLNKMAERLQQAFEELESANQKLEQDIIQKKRLLNERKELADNLSHEMKTPLGVIRAYAEGLQEEPDETKRQKYCDTIIAETGRISSLITTLLDLSALENGAVLLHPERFDFVEFLETVAGRLLMDLPDADFSLQYELPKTPVYVRTDRNRMEQVLDNLIVNAKKNVCSDGVLKLSLKENGSMLDFFIYNQGPAIPQENLPKIWTKFYHGTALPRNGSGLGLAIVAQILSMQHFNYGVRNIGDGVMFYFSIPVIK